jgi:hypothetical protein
MEDAAIHRVSGDANDLSLRLLVHSGSPRAFSPRDDKSDGFPFPLHPSLFLHWLFWKPTRKPK